jgi:hypothetical protein
MRFFYFLKKYKFRLEKNLAQEKKHASSPL